MDNDGSIGCNFENDSDSSCHKQKLVARLCVMVSIERTECTKRGRQKTLFT